MGNLAPGKSKLLLHICCAGCGVYVSQLLKQQYAVTLYFYNPNIFPKSEYNKRLAEVEEIAGKFKLDLIRGEYHHEVWLEKIRGHENDPERGERCLICYGDRLANTAKLAQKNKFDLFTTTLTVSPHKDALAISKIGNDLSLKYEVKFLDRDFKKQDGFKKSVELSKKLGLYRQNYCGCEYSYKSTN
jgi:predicted adenine nucleotide alpha hydrolase (AANH) superfamily ATPase